MNINSFILSSIDPTLEIRKLKMEIIGRSAAFLLILLIVILVTGVSFIC